MGRSTFRPAAVILTAAGAANFHPSDRARLRMVCRARFLAVPAPLTPLELRKRVGNAPFLALSHRACPEQTGGHVEGLKALRGIALFATGWDRVDLEALTRRGILLCHLPDYSLESDLIGRVSRLIGP